MTKREEDTRNIVSSNSGWDVVEDIHGVKHIALFRIIRRKRRHNHITKGEKPYSNGKYRKSQSKKNIGS